MAELNDTQNKLTLKLVYYGPALSGKTTNLIQLHELLPASARGEIMTLETRNQRTLFFDLLPVGFTAPSGLNVRFKLFTVPGQLTLDSTRKAVLSRADGIVFVADSQRNQTINNSQSFASLEDNAAKLGLSLEDTPMVIQFNKRDLPEVMSEEEIRARWAGAPWPLTFAAALSGAGVMETLNELLARVYRKQDTELGLQAQHGITLDMFVQSVTGREAAGAAA